MGIECEYRFAEYEHDRNSEPDLSDEPERKWDSSSFASDKSRMRPPRCR